MDRANQLKDDGNVAFKAGKHEDAVKLYTEAIDLLVSDGSQSHSQELAVLYCNRSFAQLKRSPPNFADALTDADLALRYDSTMKKAQFRRALALEGRGVQEGIDGLGHLEAALMALTQIVQSEPKNADALNAAQRVRTLLQKLREERSSPAPLVQRVSLCFP